MRYLSLFSGMEAAHLAWSPLGWECAAVAEIEPAACALLRHRLPHVPNLGDVTTITDATISKLGRIDVVIGGSPCQDLSVAGKRAGLVGARSGLFHQQLRIFDAARSLCGARWLVWENVPGAFSSNRGSDFAVVVGEMAGCRVDVPHDGWGTEGLALGRNGLVEWAVLDAQWFGVAQRRRRVFAVLDTGNWADRPPVLLEPDRLRGNSAPRREAGDGVAGTLTGGARRSGGYSTDDGSLIQAFGGNNTSGPIEVATARNASASASASASGRMDFESETFLVQEVAHTLRADGFDASEDGTGRGTPLIPVPFATTQITSAANGSNPKPGDPCHPLAASAHAPAIAFDCKAGGNTAFSVGDVPGTLRAAHGGGHAAVVIGVTIHGTDGTANVASYSDLAQCLRARIPGGVENSSNTVIQHAMKVRRLTPIECERLQGAPDNWTLVPNAHGKHMADGPRYKMLGNSFAVPVIRWIGEQLQRAQAQRKQEAA